MKFNAGEIASVIKTEIEGFRGLVENFAWQSRREIEIAGVTGTKTGNGPQRSSSYDAELSISFYLTKSGLFIGRV